MENRKIKDYEAVIIIKGNFTDEEYQEALKKVKNYMKDLIEIEKVEEIGLKRLAYEVKQNSKGYYLVIEFKAEVENVKELERLYRIDDNVLKFIIVRKDD